MLSLRTNRKPMEIGLQNIYRETYDNEIQRGEHPARLLNKLASANEAPKSNNVRSRPQIFARSMQNCSVCKSMGNCGELIPGGKVTKLPVRGICLTFHDQF